MNRPDYIPADYKRIQVVDSLTALFNTEFGGPDQVNCILYPRRLKGDFNALARRLDERLHVTQEKTEKTISRRTLMKIRDGLAGAERDAADAIIADMEAMRNDGRLDGEDKLEQMRAEKGAEYVERMLAFAAKANADAGYPPHQESDGDINGRLRVVGRDAYLTDVDIDKRDSIYNFHADGYDFDKKGQYKGDDETIKRAKRGRVQCCYDLPVTEYVRNEDAKYSGRKVFFNVAKKAPIYTFKPGDIWRQTKGFSEAPPFIHRAPREIPGVPPRILSID